MHKPFGSDALSTNLERRYSPDQPRDEKGRFGEGTGEAKGENKEFTEHEKKAIDQQLRDPGFVNETLRGEHELTSVQQSHVTALDSAIAKSEALKEDKAVYRATSINSLNGEGYASTQPTDGIKVGSTFTDKRYVSTTTDKASANNPGYTHPDDRMILNINVPAGTKVFEPGKAGLTGKAFELAGWEKEVLLARGSTFRIDKVIGTRELNVTLVKK
jgi:hypothetical protein